MLASQQLAEVQQLIDEGQWDAAQDKLQTLTTTVATVNDVERKQELVTQWQELTVKVDAKTPTRTCRRGRRPRPCPTCRWSLLLAHRTSTTTSTSSSETTTPPTTHVVGDHHDHAFAVADHDCHVADELAGAAAAADRPSRASTRPPSTTLPRRSPSTPLPTPTPSTPVADAVSGDAVTHSDSRRRCRRHRWPRNYRRRDRPRLPSSRDDAAPAAEAPSASAARGAHDVVAPPPTAASTAGATARRWLRRRFVVPEPETDAGGEGS